MTPEEFASKGAAYKYTYFLDTMEKTGYFTEELAIPSINVAEAQDIVARSTSENPVIIYWTTESDGNTAREMFWGTYTGGKASDTRTQEGMIALVSMDDGDDYRTVTWDTIWKLNFYDELRGKNRTVYVK